ncbi:hypothetical protein E2562_032387 [Oryza meyeriana var. granulata]|uniref:Uncharacterized protein n=1 Tax=Oryza meyeriana var. granulata TaxID=110450 RepID=A0A6G1C8S3_9ORYZ|nr:hypothetical protein E2562_032387 [Oryza meyeriana var. granulata]
MSLSSRSTSLLRAAARSTPAVSVPGRSVAAAAAAKKQVGDYVPVYVALGMIAVSVSLGLATARQQLAYAPNVRLDKKKRETVPEVAAPDMALDEAERFVGRSLFRKVAQVQDDRSLRAGVADYPARKAVTLKDAGVEPPGIEQGRKGILEVLGKNTNTAAA